MLRRANEKIPCLLDDNGFSVFGFENFKIEIVVKGFIKKDRF